MALGNGLARASSGFQAFGSLSFFNQLSNPLTTFVTYLLVKLMPMRICGLLSTFSTRLSYGHSSFPFCCLSPAFCHFYLQIISQQTMFSFVSVSLT
jgi:hypothetical protein